MFTAKFRPARTGFTIIEAIAILVLALVLIALILPALGGSHRSPTLKDASQLRGVQQGLALWAQSNQDRYPLPSRIDTNNATVPESAEAKDTTANIMSVLVFNSFFPPELLVNPAEVNGNIVRMEGYELVNPSAAVDPAHALWDPNLRADFTGNKESHISYAHSLPRGLFGPLDPNTERWGSTYIANQATIGDRGPEIASISRDARGDVTPTYKLGKDSLTFLIHGSREKWEGSIGYNDNHVNFETSVAPDSLTYSLPDGKTQRDVLFFDEPEAAGANNFLGIFIQGGPERADFKSIWD